LDPGEIDRREPLASYGLSSQQAVMLSGDLEEWLGRSLPPTLVFEYPDVDALVQYLSGAESRPSPAAGRQARPSIGEPIAIVGMGCRFPRAASLEAFWKLLEDGTDAVTVIRSRAHDPAFRRFAALLAYLSFDNGLMILHLGLLLACLMQSQVVTLAYGTVMWTMTMVFSRLVLRRPRRRSTES
jgi:acyl carrier protein